jgi:hypothetical protein
MDGYVDTLLRSDTPAAQNSTNPADSHSELVRLLTTSFHNGSDLNPADRSYVAKMVSARTGLSQADADKRVTDVTKRDATCHLADAGAVHRGVLGITRGHRGRRSAGSHMGQESTASLTTNPKGTHHADSSLAPWNTNSADYPDHVVAPLRQGDNEKYSIVSPCGHPLRWD